MKRQRNKSIIFLTIFSVILCGCPGGALFFRGASMLLDAFTRFDSVGELFSNFATSIFPGGWRICSSGILLLIPLGLVVLLLQQPKKDAILEPLEPTGVSEDEPIPPPH